MKELDPNKIAVELVKQFAKPILDGVGKLTGEAHDKLKVTLNTCFSKYITRSHDRYSKTKTLLYRDVPVNLKDFYVRTDLELGFERKVEEKEFIESLQLNKRVVISGTAGSGKSTFCKSIFLDLVEKPIGIFPIFVELRHLNTGSGTSLFEYVLNTLSDIEPTFTKSQLEYSLKLGKVLLIFDGFDELNNELREKYEKEIVNIAAKYQNILMLLSSRPDSRFSSWEEFYVYKILPLDKDKAKALISKLDYDRQVKRKFLDVLDKELFEKHESFASNPLLLTMMLLTYEQIAEIPSKVHLFYEQAFLTLFNKHDSLKSLYKRKSLSDLPLDEFKKLLSAFSVVSYVDRKYYFTESEIEKYLSNAVRVSGMDVDKGLFLNDLLDTVCIMQRDGNGYTFTHRSFQEYFTSIFMVSYSSDNKYKLLDKIAFVNDRDDVIPMIFDINKDLIEQEWLIPRMEAMISELSALPDTDQGRVELISKMYGGLVTHEGKNGTDVAFTLHRKKEGDHARFVHILFKVYGEELRRYHKAQNEEMEESDALGAKTKLIELMRGDSEHGGINLSKKDKLTPEVIGLIANSKCDSRIIINLNFIKEKVNKLREKYKNKEEELSELLFG